jgi:hypothetical protein
MGQVVRGPFADLSESRVTYDKVAHGIALTDWSCDNAREDLDELASLMVERLEKHERPTEKTEHRRLSGPRSSDHRLYRARSDALQATGSYTSRKYSILIILSWRVRV